MIPRFLQKTCSSITMYPRCLPKYKLNYFVHINRQKLVFHFIYVFFSSSHLSYVCVSVYVVVLMLFFIASFETVFGKVNLLTAFSV